MRADQIVDADMFGDGIGAVSHDREQEDRNNPGGDDVAALFAHGLDWLNELHGGGPGGMGIRTIVNA